MKLLSVQRETDLIERKPLRYYLDPASHDLKVKSFARPGILRPHRTEMIPGRRRFVIQSDLLPGQ